MTGGSGRPPSGRISRSWRRSERDEKKRMELIRAIVAAPVLPMTEDFEVDWKGLRDYLRWLAPQGPTAIAMNMDAAEGPSLSVEEQPWLLSSRCTPGRL